MYNDSATHYNPKYKDSGQGGKISPLDDERGIP